MHRSIAWTAAFLLLGGESQVSLILAIRLSSFGFVFPAAFCTSGVNCALSSERAFFRVHARLSLKIPVPGQAGTSGLFMSARQNSPYDGIASKWHALAERRRAHVVELRDSGRWKHYYDTQDELVAALRDAMTACDEWARIGGLSEGDASA